jgi:SAM-dependent methyltransferase
VGGDENQLFAETIVDNYHRRLGPLIFEDYARDLAARTEVPPGGRVLETACGSGIVTRHLHDKLGDGSKLVATDINPGMLEAARANLGDRNGVEFRVADGTDLPFEDGSFDAVVCQFGVMFYADKERGYAETARVLGPGGSYVFNVWDSLAVNEICGFAHEQAARMFPDDPPGFMTVPFGYYDEDRIKGELHRAGFSEIESAVIPRTSRAPSARDVALAICAGSPLGLELVARGAFENILEEYEAAIAAEFGTGEISAPMQAIAFVARKSSV